MNIECIKVFPEYVLYEVVFWLDKKLWEEVKKSGDSGADSTIKYALMSGAREFLSEAPTRLNFFVIDPKAELQIVNCGARSSPNG